MIYSGTEQGSLIKIKWNDKRFFYVFFLFQKILLTTVHYEGYYYTVYVSTPLNIVC